MARLARLRAAAARLRGGPLVSHGRAARRARRRARRDLLSAGHRVRDRSRRPRHRRRRRATGCAQYPRSCRSAAPTSRADRRDRAADRAPTSPTTPAFARDASRRLLRPGGLLVQDVQLSTLPFVPADRWWESIYRRRHRARPVRRAARRRCGSCRTSAATRRRSAAICSRRASIRATSWTRPSSPPVVVPAIAAIRRPAFPLIARRRGSPTAVGASRRVARRAERAELARRRSTCVAVAELPRRTRTRRPPRRARAAAALTRRGEPRGRRSWRALSTTASTGGAGLPVIGVGERVGPPGADRAEPTNLAARHIHTLRSRLQRRRPRSSPRSTPTGCARSTSHVGSRVPRPPSTFALDASQSRRLLA